MARPTTDLAEWLGRHGLGQYAQTFAENNIDYSVLPDLTEDDLEKLGVSLGHRKKLLRAIDAVRPAGRARGTTEVSQIGTEAISPVQHRDAEFRQITVMFCDLVGSTQLSEKLDPEDLQKLIDAYRGECRTAIGRYGGEVARYFGDGVMAFFGWPHAHEDDAVRAVHAALEIVSGVTKISGPVTLASRVGVCSGPVVVGETGRQWHSLVDGCGGRDAEYCRASTDPCRRQHGTHLGIDETSRIGSFRFSGPWPPGTQRRNRTSSRVPRARGQKYREPVRCCACGLSHSARWTLNAN